MFDLTKINSKLNECPFIAAENETLRFSLFTRLLIVLDRFSRMVPLIPNTTEHLDIY